MEDNITLFWFRRDLRLNDNCGLFYALKENKNVMPIFIFDKNILNKLEDKKDRRVDFIRKALKQINDELAKIGSTLTVFYDDPKIVFEKLIKEKNIKNVYSNHDYEPYATKRDHEIKEQLATHKIDFKTFKDQVIFEKNEVLKDDGSPYSVFTPYSHKWKKKLSEDGYKAHLTEIHFDNFIKSNKQDIRDLNSMGFFKTDVKLNISITVSDLMLEKYKEQRNYPCVEGTSKISMHLRFGLLSVRSLVSTCINKSETWLNELIWREFYMMILWHYPHVAENAFKKKYNLINWKNNIADFKKWCNGETGFGMVDAGMRELNATGFMHNRVRMIVSSFLIKDLLIDWRWGEAYFAQKLNDFDLSANNGGWQWAAGSGCDAAPYFRIFNPNEQQKKFDPELKYIKKWIPEFGTPLYPAPMIDHKAARLRALKEYKEALNQSF